MAEAQQWTEERLEKLKKLWDEGLSISQIGEQLGVSRNAIAGKVHRLGLKKRQSPISNKGKARPKPHLKKNPFKWQCQKICRLNWHYGKSIGHGQNAVGLLVIQKQLVLSFVEMKWLRVNRIATPIALMLTPPIVNKADHNQCSTMLALGQLNGLNISARLLLLMMCF